MKFRDIREFNPFLDGKWGELCRVYLRQWTTRLEIAEIADRMIKAWGSRAAVSRTPRATTSRCLINIFGSKRRMAMALGLSTWTEAAGRVQGNTQLVQGPPEGGREQLRTLVSWSTWPSVRPRTP